MNAGVMKAIANAREVLGETATLDVVRVDEGTIVVRFVPNPNADKDCDTCQLSVDDVKFFILESLSRFGTPIDNVRLEVVQHSG